MIITYDVTMTYDIPEEIDNQIPDYFYYAMAGELFSIYGPNLFRIQEHGYDLDSSTSGWVCAFKATCLKLGLKEVLDYYIHLSWWNSDIFDGIIEDRIIDKVIKNGNYNANTYYKYLFEKC